MKNTTNYSLNKPDFTDFADIEKLNDNFDIIDTKIKEVEKKADKTDITDHLNDMAHIKVSNTAPIDMKDGNLWFELGKSSEVGGGESGLLMKNAILSDGAPGDTTALWLDYDEEELIRYGK